MPDITCWHKQIDNNGMCKDCGKKAAITLRSESGIVARVPTEDEIDLVLARLFFSDNPAWVAMLGLRYDRDRWKRGLEGVE